jgi:SAM-dependent methyltransferase
MKEICGDVPLSRAEKFRYLLRNSLSMPKDLFSFLWVKRWFPKDVTRLAEGDSSSFRKLLDAYVDEQFASLAARRSSKTISVLDIGCGSGYVRRTLARHGFSGTYVGVDATLDNRFAMHEVPEFRSSSLTLPIERFHTENVFDLVVSMTSFEHIEDDAIAAQVANANLARDGFALHVVPSAWCLPIYLFHGYRQYTAGRLRRLFGKKAQIVAIGGAASYFLQFFCYTIFERLLKRGVHMRSHPSYSKWTRTAARMDRFLPFFPMVYAVRITNEHE